jgi:hypothetical protein
MSAGSCLCGSLTWEFNGEVRESSHCHCSMCRKAHGAAFATFYMVNSANFKWTSDLSMRKMYYSSQALARSFCAQCGSVVPGTSDEDMTAFIPAGCHDQGPQIESHIFVDSKAPWLTIIDNLPQHNSYPQEEENTNNCPDKIISKPIEGVVRGSCLCGKVEFEVVEPFQKIHNCHCQRCRRARAAAFTTNGFTSDDGVRYTKGEEHLASYKLPEAKFFTQVFCDTCGSGLPRVDTSRKIAITPLGALDDNPGQTPDDNIFVSNKAEWHEVSNDIPCFDEGPE